MGADQCVEVSGGGPSTCKTCGAIIGGTKYCSACNDSGSTAAPTNGVCTTDNNECSVKADGRCTTCAQESFMFQGGCYRTGQDPGQAMCQTAQNGKCTLGADGYFALPEAAATEESVAACNTTTTITLKNSKKYVGVDKCKTCNAPSQASGDTAEAATCTACEDGYFVDTSASSKKCTACTANCNTCSAAANNKCSACVEGYFVGASGNEGECVKCDATTGPDSYKGVTGCAKCTKPNTAGAATCTECTGDLYLKTDGSTTSCVAAGQCNDGFFPTTDSKNKKVCVKCSATDNGGIENCAKCSLKASSARAGAAVTCTECTSNKLSPLGDACLIACPAGTYDDNSICKPCHVSCAECNNNAEATSCTACYPGRVLSKGADTTKGTCIKECTGAFMAHCKTDGCTLDVGGSRYCDACENGYAPIDGVCTAIAAGARDASGCKANDGKCTACTGANYALLSSGCYNTQMLPGMSVCTAANSGSCTTCANGQTYTSGTCPACAEGCAKCATNANTCTACLAGYYLSNSKCFKCTADSNEGSNAITGVPNCVSCAAPASSGPVTCYVTQTPTVDPTDPSTNKGGLSSGAIAGISVAVIAVVGGLVGFLCWWFVCRGKA
ncbi:Variant-specific surface protein [Giardia duodenalis]|uniref:Variant-specific surface protein n=1 Tax=Giardia intestinalis TaxID=5741 RepID=V6TQN0_GIAIN|nr:Variant-specific surface protein [Giardia intestinalis]